MNVQFNKLISRLKVSGSPSEREEIIEEAVSQYVLTCQQLGMILMHMRYSSERQRVAGLLAPKVVDPENSFSHLLPFIACESVSVREHILNTVASGGS